ncbi:hypothetical protein [Nocardioides sp.]|uniref:hypothetical protein n=1 Tax=Nocardioides sp. TaxID=35761 RepID=UPI003D126B66
MLARLTIAALVLSVAAPVTSAVAAPRPIEDYAPYQPQTRCVAVTKPGTKVLGRWIVHHFGGGFGPTKRACTGSSTSEHKEGRAFDWVLDARRPADRKRARTFLTRAFATDGQGNEHARARRMGIMYVIWNDHMYAAYDRFEPKPYLSSSCPSRKKCSATLRHRNHLHISLTRGGGNGYTSWYDGRLPD